MSEPVWQSAEGPIPISEMTTSHLLNSIRYLEKNAQAMLDTALGNVCAGAAMLQGEMATMHADNEMAALSNMDSHEYIEQSTPYTALVEEWERRTHMTYEPYAWQNTDPHAPRYEE